MTRRQIEIPKDPSPRSGGGALSRFRRLVRSWRRDESGALLVEFSVTLLLLFLFCFGTLEYSYLKMRQIALDRATDKAFRELRLGLIPDPDHDKVKAAICDKPLARFVLSDCATNLLLEVREVPKSDWSINTGEVLCLDTTPDEDYEPPIEFTAGTENQMMIARACLIQRALFPGMRIFLSLPRYDDFGNFALVSRSAFVNEPF